MLRPQQLCLRVCPFGGNDDDPDSVRHSFHQYNRGNNVPKNSLESKHLWQEGDKMGPSKVSISAASRTAHDSRFLVPLRAYLFELMDLLST